MGIESLLKQNTQNIDPTGISGSGQFDFMDKGMYPMSQTNRSHYSTPSQLPLGAQAAEADYDPETNPLTGELVARFAKGGIAALHFDGEDGSQVEDPNAPVPPTVSNQDLWGLAIEPEEAQRLNDLKINDQKQYNTELINALGNQLKTNYQTNENYDDIGKRFNALREQDPNAWYKKQLEFLGNQQGWQIGQNRSDRLESIQPHIDNTIKDAKAAGISDKEINSILGGSSQEARNKNVQRIANLAETGGSGFNFQKDVQPGLVMLALATAAAATANPEIIGLGETAGAGAAAMGPTYAELGYIPAAEAAGAGSVGADTLAQAGPTYGELGYTPQMGPTYGELGYAPQAGPTYGELGYTGSPASQMGPTYSELGYQGAGAKSTTDAIAASDAAAKAAAKEAAGMNTYQKLMAGSLAMRALGGAGGSAGGGGSGSMPTSTTTTTSTPQQQYPQQQYPQQQQLVMSPYMTPMNTSGSMYNPLIYGYNTRRAAQGGMMYGNGGGISTLGSYSDGGRLLKGPGDGMSDNIPAKIGQHQPAALADGEFVVPADVVSHLGNGSTDAGAKQLYKMMDQIRQARTGRKSQGKKINPNKFLPKE